MNNKNCTTHWNRIDEFAKRYPNSKILKDRLFVRDGNIFTSAGVSSGIDLSLKIAEIEFGQNITINIAKQLVLFFRRGDADPQLSPFLQYRNHIDQRMHSAQNYISENIGRNVTVDDIADEVNMSRRNLTRQFKKVTGMTIVSYKHMLIIDRAKRLLADGHSFSDVVDSCGLKSVSHLKSMLNRNND